MVDRRTRLPRSPLEGAPTADDAQAPRRPSLSPSRAADFKTCPLLYRFRTIDRLPERKSLAAVRGTLVHSVLERLYDLPGRAAHRRGRAGAARAGVGGAARGARRRGAVRRGAGGRRGDRRQRAGVGGGVARRRPGSWSRSTSRWRTRPASSRTAARSSSRSRCPTGCCCAATSTGSTWRPNGALRVVDYKTGAVPREAFEGKALFQMKFYALVLWRTRGVVASQLKLLYLKDGDALTYAPDEDELRPLRAHPAGDLGGHRARRRHRRLPAQQDPALRLVRPPGVLPRVGRHSPAVPDRGRRGGRLADRLPVVELD